MINRWSYIFIIFLTGDIRFRHKIGLNSALCVVAIYGSGKDSEDYCPRRRKSWCRTIPAAPADGYAWNSEEEVRERHATSRSRQSRSEEPRRSHQRLGRASVQASPTVIRDNSLHVIKTLKGWGLRYSGDEKESPEQFLSRLNACKWATGIPDE